MNAKCKFCGEAIAAHRDYRLVQGWERIHRSQGGTNALRLREPKSDLACWSCIEKESRGVAADQGGLFA